MPLPIEDYGLIGDTHGAALVGRDGSVDWLCVPRFDADPCFAALLGEPKHGRWLLPPDDARVRGTVEAIEENLVRDGLVHRYSTASGVDGLPPGEGVFLPCSLWLADNLALLGRHAEARRMYERVLSLQNDLGLLSEEYDPARDTMLGNFPQALTHVALINTARYLSGAAVAEPRERVQTEHVV